jgi:2',3'-cyclic-nucleotide 2'-phosphodiesterase (5'-nucleotidase family)
MHAAIEEFPQLAAIADSLRALYPSMLILSAGDNRTGNPKNDMFRISSYPMVTLMNLVGFDATTLGNHEFDVGSLPPLMAYSAFSYICANIYPSEETGLHIVPTKVYAFDGIKIGISQGFNKIALVADSEYDHLIRLYESIGFVPAEHRHAFGTDFMRMIYSV